MPLQVFKVSPSFLCNNAKDEATDYGPAGSRGR